jgi:hypothetical protein
LECLSVCLTSLRLLSSFSDPPLTFTRPLHVCCCCCVPQEQKVTQSHGWTWAVVRVA